MIVAAIVAHLIAIMAAGCVGALTTYIACSLHCEHAHHIETEQPQRHW